MTLTSDLEHQFNTLHASLPPEVSKTIISTTSAFKESYSPSAAPEIGDPLPPFTLTAADGTPTTTASLLSFPEGIEGYLLIAFYRGSWCPFCNIFLRSLASHLQEFKEAGVKLVAVSPELPDTNSETVEELGLEFPVLTDRWNGLAKKLGILYKQPESMKGVLRDFGVDFEKSNGDGRYEVGSFEAYFLITDDDL